MDIYSLWLLQFPGWSKMKTSHCAAIFAAHEEPRPVRFAGQYVSSSRQCPCVRVFIGYIIAINQQCAFFAARGGLTPQANERLAELQTKKNVYIVEPWLISWWGRECTSQRQLIREPIVNFSSTSRSSSSPAYIKQSGGQKTASQSLLDRVRFRLQHQRHSRVIEFHASPCATSGSSPLLLRLLTIRFYCVPVRQVPPSEKKKNSVTYNL